MRYSFGGVAGLDYPAVFQTVAIYGYEITPYDLSGLQSMESDLLKDQSEVEPKKEEGKK